MKIYCLYLGMRYKFNNIFLICKISYAFSLFGLKNVRNTRNIEALLFTSKETMYQKFSF